MVAPDLPPNHGTVIVHVDGDEYLVDASLLTAEPLLLDDRTESTVSHPAWGVRCRSVDGKFVISWRPQLRPEGLDCRIDSLLATVEEFRDFHEGTRAWGPFNYEFSLRANRNNQVVGIAHGQRVDIDGSGEVIRGPMTHADRIRFLVETVGWSEEMAIRLPVDVPTPPPPGSRTAMALASS
jgi:N-hydroxyarylamine O-acetyltransferase